jgi:tetratricopeptide (TPR) repeat protein
MNVEDILYRLKQIQEDVDFVDEGHVDMIIQNDDLDWLVEQAKENKKLKESIDRGEEKYREEILPELQKIHQENKKLKTRLDLADILIKKSKELTDLYQAQIERYEKALENSQTIMKG